MPIRDSGLTPTASFPQPGNRDSAAEGQADEQATDGLATDGQAAATPKRGRSKRWSLSQTAALGGAVTDPVASATQPAVQTQDRKAVEQQGHAAHEAPEPLTIGKPADTAHVDEIQGAAGDGVVGLMSPLPPPPAAAGAAPLTLLLFEEVDCLQDEDRGFLSVLQELLTTSKASLFVLHIDKHWLMQRLFV